MSVVLRRAATARLFLRIRPALALATVTLTIAAAPDRARADVLTQDALERQQLARDLPAASAALARAEQALAGRRFEEATAALAEARRIAPRSPLAARRHCEVLAGQGRKAEALAACDRAKALGGGPLEMRATVSAYLAGDAPPTSDDLAHAWFYAMQVQRQVPTLAYGAAARCEIALRIGDGRLAASCLAELAQLAPQETERQRLLPAATTAQGFGLGSWLGLLGLALAGLGTAAHAWSRGGRNRLVPRAPVITALLLTGLSLARPAQAQVSPDATAAHLRAATAAQAAPQAPGAPPGDLSKGHIDEANPEASVPTPDKVNPLEYGYVLQDLLARAEVATKRNDWPAVVKYYRAIVKMVPDRSAGFSKLCEAYEKTGDAAMAIKSCALALSAGGVLVEDYARFVRLVLAQPGPVTPDARARIEEAITHLRKDGKTALSAEHLACELALRVNDQALLASCTERLVAGAPGDARTVGFQWALAMQRQEFSDARDLVERARQAGVRPDGLADMARMTDLRLREQRTRQITIAVAVLAALGGLAILAVTLRRKLLGRESPA